MGPWFRQLGLVLKKNFLLKRRQPFIFFLSLFWPIIVFLIIYGVRQMVPPHNKPTCYYNARALPSAGALPFLQSLICNIDNDCLNETSYEEIPSYSQARLQELVEKIEPLMSDEEITDIVRALPKGISLMKSILETIEQPNIHSILYQGIPIKSLLKDSDRIKDIFKNEMKIDNEEAINAIINSNINMPKFIQLMGYNVKLSKEVCNSTQLSNYLVVEDEAALEEASAAFCNLSSDSLSNLIEKFQKEIDVGKIMAMMSQLMNSFGQPTVGQSMMDIARMLDTILTVASQKFESLMHWLPQIQGMISSIKDGDIDLKLLQRIVQDLKPFTEAKNQRPAVKFLLKYFTNLLHLVRKYAQKLPEELSLGSLFSNHREIEDMVKKNISLTNLRYLFKISMQPSLKDLISNTTLNQEIFDLLCVNPGLSSFIKHKFEEQNESIHLFQKIVCYFSGNETIDTVLNRFALDFIKQENDTCFEEIFNETAEALESISNLTDDETTTKIFPLFQLTFDIFTNIFTKNDSFIETDILLETLSITLDFMEKESEWSEELKVIKNILGNFITIASKDVSSSYKAGVKPFWPYFAETVLNTLSSDTKWEALTNITNWPDMTCQPNNFNSVFNLTQLSYSEGIQKFSCDLSKDIIDMTKHMESDKNISSSKKNSWPVLINRLSLLFSQAKELYSSPKWESYDWNRLTKAKNDFVAINWNSKTRTERITFLTSAFSNFTRALETQQVKFWNDFMAIGYSIDSFISLVDGQLGKILEANDIKLSYIMNQEKLPSLKKIIKSIIVTLPEFIESITNTIANDLIPTISRIIHNSSKTTFCSKVITKLFTFRNESLVKDLEDNVCSSLGLLAQEVFSHPTIGSIMKAVQDVNKGEKINLNWTEISTHIVDITDKIEALKHFNGSYFSDIPSFDPQVITEAFHKSSKTLKDTFKVNNLQNWIHNILESSLKEINLATLPANVTFSQLYQQKKSSEIEKIVAALKFGFWSFSEIGKQSYPLLNTIFGFFNEEPIAKEIIDTIQNLPSAVVILSELITRNDLFPLLTPIQNAPVCEDTKIFQHLVNSFDDKKIAKKLFKIICTFNINSKEENLLKKVLDLPKIIMNAWNNKTVTELPFSLTAIKASLEKVTSISIQAISLPSMIEWDLRHTLKNGTYWEKIAEEMIKVNVKAGKKRFSYLFQNLLNPQDENSLLSWPRDPDTLIATIGVLTEMEQYFSENSTDSSKFGLALEITNWADDYLSDYIEIFLHTLHSRPEKIISLLQRDSEFWQLLCNTSSDKYFEIPKHLNAQQFEIGLFSLCQIDFKEVLKKKQFQYLEKLDLKLKQQLLAVKIGSTLDVIFFSNNSQLYTFLNESKWEEMIKRISPLNTNDWISETSTKFALAASNTPMFQSLSQIVNNFKCSIQAHSTFLNKTISSHYFIQDQQIFHIFQIIFDTIMDGSKLTLIGEKFILNKNEDGLSQFCSSNNWHEYFNIRVPEANQALHYVQNIICSKLKKTCPFNKEKRDAVTDFTSNIIEISKFAKQNFLSPTLHARASAPLEPSDFLKMFKQFWSQINSTSSQNVTISSLPTWLQLIGPTLEWIPDTRPSYHFLEAAFKAISERIDNLNYSKAFFIEDLFPNSPNLKSFVHKWMLILPEVVETAIWSQISHYKLYPLISKPWGQVKPLLCNNSVSDYFYNPQFQPHDWEALTDLICKEEYNIIWNELKSEISLQPFILALNDTTPIDWKSFGNEVSTFLTKVQNLAIAKIPLDRTNHWTQPIVWINIFKNISRIASDSSIPIRIILNNMADYFELSLKLPSCYNTTSTLQNSRCLFQESSNSHQRARLASNRMADIIINAAQHQIPINWNEFVQETIKMVQLNEIVHDVTKGKVAWKSLETDAMKVILANPKKNWTEYLAIIPLTMNTLSPHLNQIHDSKTIGYFFSTLINMSKQKLDNLEKQNDFSFEVLENIFEEFPSVQKFMKMFFFPHLSDIVTTLFWTANVESKTKKLIADGQFSLELTLETICKNDVHKYLYNPTLTTEQLNSFVTALCNQKYQDIISEIRNKKHSFIPEKDFEWTENSWDLLARNMVDLVLQITKLSPKLPSAIKLSSFPEISWEQVFANLTITYSKPEVSTYLTLNPILYSFCNNYSMIHSSQLPSTGNATHLQEVLCEMSTEQYSNQASVHFKKFLHFVSQILKQKPVDWKNVYNTSLLLINSEKIISTTFGAAAYDNFQMIGKQILLMLDSKSIHNFRDISFWKNLINGLDSFVDVFPNATYLPILKKNIDKFTSSLNLLEPLLKFELAPNNFTLINSKIKLLQTFYNIVNKLELKDLSILSLVLEKTSKVDLKSFEWESYFCDRHKLVKILTSSDIMKARKALCGSQIGSPLYDALKIWDKQDLINKFQTLTENGTIEVLSEVNSIVNFILTQTPKSKQSNFELSSDIIQNNNNFTTELELLETELNALSKSISQSSEGRKALAIIQYNQWYLSQLFNSKLKEPKGEKGYLSLGGLLSFDIKQLVSKTLTDYPNLNQSLFELAFDPLKIAKTNSFSDLMCSKNLESRASVNTSSKLTITQIQDIICQSSIIKPLTNFIDLNYIKKDVIGHNGHEWALLLANTRELIKKTSEFTKVHPQLILNTDFNYLVNITRLLTTVKQSILLQRAYDVNGMVKISFSLLRFFDTLNNHQLTDFLHKYHLPWFLSKLEKSFETSPSIYHAISSHSFWKQIFGKHFSSRNQISFSSSLADGLYSLVNYFNQNPNILHSVCDLKLQSDLYDNNKPKWFKQTLKYYCLEPISKWYNSILQSNNQTELIEASLTLQSLLNENSTSEPNKRYLNWLKEYQFNLTETSLVNLIDKLTLSPEGMFKMDTKIWKSILDPIWTTLPTSLDDIDEKLCATGNIGPKETAISNIGLKIIDGLPDIETLFCYLPNQTFSGFYEWVSKSFDMKHIFELANQINDDNISTSLPCATFYAPVAAAAKYHYAYSSAIANIENTPGIKKCMETAKEGPLWASIQKYGLFIKTTFGFAKEILNITKSEYNNTQVLFDSLRAYVSKQMPAFNKIAKFLDDPKALIKKLQGQPFNFTSEIIESLLKSSVNLNWLVQRNFSQSAIERAVCKGKYIQEVISIPKDPNLSQNETRFAICNEPGALEALLQSMNIQEIFKELPDLQNKQFKSGRWLDKLLFNAENLMNNILDLTEIGSQLFSGFTADLITAITRIFQENTVDKLLDSLHDLTATLQPVISGSQALDSIRTIVRGVQGLKILQGRHLFDIEYQLKDFFFNFSKISNLLEDELNLNQDASKSILDSTLNISSLLNNSKSLTMRDLICKSGQLEKILIIDPSFNISFDNLTSTICDVSAKDLLKASSHLLKELALSRIIKNFAKLGIEGVLEKASLNWDEAIEAFNTLKKAPVVGPKIQGHIKDLVGSLDPSIMENIGDLNLSSGLHFLATPQALKASGKILCGKPLKALQNEFQIIQMSPKHSAPTIDQREVSMLPSEFCKDGYGQVMKMPGGPLVWGFLKPVLRGKILYTPDNRKTQLIMNKLNSTFDDVSKFIDTLHAWTEGTLGINYLRERQDTMEKMKELINDDVFKPLLDQFLGTEAAMMLRHFDIPDINNNLSNVSGILNLVQLVGNMSQCFNLNRFQGYPTERTLEIEATKLNNKREFIAAIVFTNLDDSDESEYPILPTHIHYKIRMDIDNVPTTMRIKSKFWRPGPKDNFMEDMRYFRGFLQIQEMVDATITSLQTNNRVTYTPKTFLQQFPYPCHLEDEFGYFLKSTLPLLASVGFLLMVALIIREKVLEKELNLEEMMQVMGLMPSISTCAWFITSILNLVFCIFAIGLVLKFGGIFPLSNFAILLIFLFTFAIYMLMYSYLISVFFKMATLAALAGIILYLISSVPYILILTLETEIKFMHKIFSCLILATSFCFGSAYLNRYEDQGIGLKWDNIFQSQISDDKMNFGIAIVMNILGSAIYFVIAWYIHNVWACSKVQRKPYFFFLNPAFWKKQANRFKRNLPSEIDLKLKSFPEADFPTAIPSSGISIKNLKVIYCKGKKKERIAVHSLTLELCEGQITTLLGQNGAGKTTTINVLTGQYPPTSGSVHIYGKRIPEEVEEARKMIGYCPQYNTLFNLMSIREHLKFYGEIKGILSEEKLENDIDEMLQNMGLWDQQHELACRLSGGTQRRLCVALAFIGGSKLIILDEPTSSVDPVARRSIWDLIIKYRYGRTILLTTHHMDEADLLSDRVAIVHHGKLLCTGSPLLLKNQYGCGYQLTLTRQGLDIERDSDSGRESASFIDSKNKGDSDNTLNFIQNLIPNALLMEETFTELVVSLPQQSSDGFSYNFSEFFQRLDANLSQLGFTSYGLSSTTLEEVFLTLTNHENNKNSKEPPQRMFYNNEYNPFKCSDIKEDPSSSPGPNLKLNFGSPNALNGYKLKFQQLSALLMKRFYHTINDLKSLVCSIIMPCIFITIAMGFATLKPPPIRQQLLALTPPLYGPNAISFKSFPSSNYTAYKFVLDNLIEYPGIGTSCMNSTFEPMKKMCNLNSSFDEPSFQPITGIGGAKGCLFAKPLKEKFDYDISPTSDVIYDISGVNINDYILSTYLSFPEKRYGGWSYLSENSENIIKIWYENTGFHSAPSYLNSLSNSLLRANVRKRGLDDASKYGITVYNHPIQLTKEQLGRDTVLHRVAELGVGLVFLLGFAFIPSSFVVYLVRERMSEEKRLQYVSGVGPILYWVSALIWDMLLILISTSFAAIIIVSFGLPIYVAKDNFKAVIALILLFGWSSTPLMYLLEKLFKESSISFMVLYSVNVFLGLNMVIIMLILSLFTQTISVDGWVNTFCLAFPQYSLVGGLISIAKNNIQAEVLEMFGQDTYMNPFSSEVVGQNCIAMGAEGFIFFILCILLEIRALNAECLIPLKASNSNTEAQNELDEDADVIDERNRVQSDASKDDILKIINLSQFFRSIVGNKCALANLNLAIPKGECFGLLGVNGAGKTTLFRILTGHLQPSRGQVQIDNTSVGKLLATSSQLLGYCPQADALDDLLTTKQHLVIYAKLRGIPSHEIETIITRALAKFQLEIYSNRKVGTLSGGTRRKVCTAISMLGNPQIILLDEPTTGMDPVTRRLVWTNIQLAVKDNRSVILTSHSMEECDILCSRLAIMVNGRLKCIGGPQYLKHKFGTGYTISLKMTDGVIDWNPVLRFIQNYFPKAIVRAHHFNMVEFSLPNKDMPLSKIFQYLEKYGSTLGILDISVSQTTLDQVFVSFARQQTDGLEVSERRVSEVDSRAILSTFNPMLLNQIKESQTIKDVELGLITKEDEGNINFGFQGDNISEKVNKISEYEITHC